MIFSRLSASELMVQPPQSPACHRHGDDAGAGSRDGTAGAQGPPVASAEGEGLPAALGKVRRAVADEQEALRRLQEGVASAREAGATWEQIAGELGVTRQAASKRFGVRTPEPAPDQPSLF